MEICFQVLLSILTCAATTGYVSGHSRSALRVWDTAALLVMMAAFAGVMCAIARGEDDRARRYFVKAGQCRLTPG
jgi:fructose-1,6-bisphosphatase/inositol monophosphatase family enzyme